MEPQAIVFVNLSPSCCNVDLKAGQEVPYSAQDPGPVEALLSGRPSSTVAGLEFEGDWKTPDSWPIGRLVLSAILPSSSAARQTDCFDYVAAARFLGISSGTVP